ncbi:MAG: hypothetical protein E6J34_03040 [Chloroflexi bacterium]|nr:MAG: hypothetical protein E6J34_03040 [Chloroflexota bacterium]
MLYKHKNAGRIRRYLPGKDRKHGFYLEADVRRLAEEKHNFFDVQSKDATFSRATLTDMEGVVKLASKLFHNVVPVINRQQWVFKEPRGHYVIKLADGSVIAYAHILAFPLDKIEAHMRHELRQQDFDIADVQAFQSGQHYETLLVAIGVDPAIKEHRRRTALSSVLLRGISEDLAQIGKEGIIIDHLYAWSDTNEGILLCAKMGMHPWAPPVKPSKTEKRRYSYVLDVLNSPIPLLQPYIQNIRRWMTEHSVSQELNIKNEG